MKSVLQRGVVTASQRRTGINEKRLAGGKTRGAAIENLYNLRRPAPQQCIARAEQRILQMKPVSAFLLRILGGKESEERQVERTALTPSKEVEDATSSGDIVIEVTLDEREWSPLRTRS